MKNSFTIMLLSLSLSATVCGITSDYVSQYKLTNDKTALNLNAYFHSLVRDCDRMEQKLELYSQEMQAFNEKLKQQASCRAFLNRSIKWANSTIFEIDNHIRAINNLYETCMCLSGRIDLTDDLKAAMKKAEQRYHQVRDRAMGLKTVIVAFKNKVQPNLN